MRGKAVFSTSVVHELGITPAYAGKSCSACHAKEKPWDHPRVCGEKPDFFFVLEIVLGSPPRMRGKGVNVITPLYHVGITPAYAGKSNVSSVYEVFVRDHPRVCGEKYFCT